MKRIDTNRERIARELRHLGWALIALFPLLAAAENITHSYDALNRLIRTDYGNGQVVEYSYDAEGNRLTQVVADREVSQPVAVTVAEVEGNLGAPVRLDGSQSYDPNPGKAKQPLKYVWSYASGPARPKMSRTKGARPVVIPTHPGDYLFTLQVKNRNGVSPAREVSLHVPAAIQVTAPAAGLTWTLGQSNEIRWAFTGINPKRVFAIYLVKDDGQSRLRLKAGVRANRGVYAWNVRNTGKNAKYLGSQAAIEVCLPKTGRNVAVCGSSDGVLAIQ